MFFPRRYDPHTPSTLPEEFLADVYDHTILPTIRETNVPDSTAWPNSYTLVCRKARGQRGRFSSVSFDILPGYLEVFAPALIRRLNDMGGHFRDAFFELEAKGIKGTSFHDPSDAAARTLSLERVLDPLDISKFKDEELKTRWWVDVALEVHEAGRVLLWLSEAHTRLIRHVLPNITPEQATALVRGQSYKQDFNAHLTAISGFRLEPRSRGRADHVSYINCYTTDKAVTYQTNPGLYRRRTSSDLYPKKMRKLLEDIHEISNTFSRCAGREGTTQDGCARIEVRVNIHFARKSLTSISDQLIQLSVLSVPSVLWWSVLLYSFCLSNISNNSEQVFQVLPHDCNFPSAHQPLYHPPDGSGMDPQPYAWFCMHLYAKRDHLPSQHSSYRTGACEILCLLVLPPSVP